MLSAEQARNLAGVEEEDEKRIKENLEEVNRRITEAALTKQRSVILSEDFWTDNKFVLWERAKNILEELGYSVDFCSNRGGLSKSAFTRLSW